MKRIVVIVASMIWFGQAVSFWQGIGVLLTFCGLWLYQGAKMATSDGGLSARPKDRRSADESVVIIDLQQSPRTKH